MHALLGTAALLSLVLSALASLGTHLTTKETRARLLRARRGLGLASFAAALFHALASLAHLHATSFTSVWNRLLALGYVRHGALALLVLLALTLTSFPKLNARARIAHVGGPSSPRVRRALSRRIARAEWPIT